MSATKPRAKYKTKTTRLPVPLTARVRRAIRKIAKDNDWSEAKTASALIEMALRNRDASDR